MTNEIVSVIIPTYSRAQYICRAIDSVINQTYQHIEIIVVDDNGEGSENQLSTYQKLKPYITEKKIRYITHKENKNGAAARNTGIKNAIGQYICFLDDDDEFLPSKIQIQIDTLKQLDSTYAGVFCNSIHRVVSQKGEFTDKTPNSSQKQTPDVEDVFLCKTRFGTSSLMLRKSICIELKGFDESFKRHQDWEFIIRILLKYKLKKVEEEKGLLYYYGYPINHNRPTTNNILTYREKYLNKFKKEIERLPSCNAIYFYHYYSVGVFFLDNRKYKDGFQTLHIASHYKKIKLSIFLKIIYHISKGILK